MKKQKLSIPLLFLILVIGIPFYSPAQDDEVTTTESVRVVNVEVPVRVFLKGSPVDNLTKSNFNVFEDGKPQEINGFFIRRKKIVAPEVPADMAKKNTFTNSRYFVLVFKITQYNDQLQKSLDYLFKNVFQESDQCLVFINDKSLFFKNLSDMDHVKAILNQSLLEESHNARRRMTTYLKKIEDELNMSRVQALMTKWGSRSADEIIRFLEKYILIWKDYKRTYIQPNLDNYYYFSRHLEKIKKDKWVINFYQFEMVPKLKHVGTTMEEIRDMVGGLLASAQGEHIAQARNILSLLQYIDLELHTSKDFPAEEISKLFFKVDATFHSILIHVNRDLLSEDLEYKRISTEIENSLSEITKRTGGSLQTTGDLESALGNIREKEDITYMLTYSPDNPDKIGKIRVEVDHDNVEILYDDQMRADYIREYLRKKNLEVPDIRIMNTKFNNKILSMDIKDFLLAHQHDSIQKGQIFIEIEILDSGNQTMYNQKKTIVVDRDHISLAIDFPWMKKGRYNIIVQATDIRTGKTSSDFIQPLIR